MFKFLFMIITNPLGLPINVLYEYLILLFVGEVAYRLAYSLVGKLLGEGILSDKTVASAAHWIIRAVIYIVMWATLRLGIQGYCLILGLIR